MQRNNKNIFSKQRKDMRQPNGKVISTRLASAPLTQTNKPHAKIY